MDLILLIATLSVVLGGSWAWPAESKCVRANARTCGECIQVSKTCGWCSDTDFQWQGQPTLARCDDVQSLLRRRCNPRKIENPRGSITIRMNKPLTDPMEKRMLEEITQIQPQKLALALRLHEPQTFELKFKRAEDYAIDLYFLMDLSSSMKDDLENVKNLAYDLMMEMLKITTDFRIGFGTVEKTPVTLSSPCTGNQNCTSTFTFKNILKLTDDRHEFIRLLSQQQISGDQDSPQGGLDAIMQVAVCEEEIGWRNVTRLLVFSTDAGFHVGGKLGSTILPNDGECHLQNNVYTMSHSRDYPSIHHVARTLYLNNIQAIFAVTEEIQPVYEELKNRFPKSAVGTLTSNSSNVIKLITDAYNSLSSQVVLENSMTPVGVPIAYRSVCMDGVVGIGENGRKCSNVSIGDEVSFHISIEAQTCPSHGKPEVITIRPFGLAEEVEVVLNFICDCQCATDRVPNSDKCYNGTLECGACKCNTGRIGHHCECSTDDVQTEDLDAGCRKDSSSDICSNNGDCVCGTCECKKRENPSERYSGRYCECDNFNCDRSNNKLCGGHGRCECRKCICEANYTGSACDCSLDTSTCLAKNGQICNGRGTCECGLCKCTDPKFQGPTCEICPTCPGVCAEHRACVQCRAFRAGEKKDTCERDCSYLNVIMVNSVDELPQPHEISYHLRHCKERDDNDCWYYYTYAIRDGIKESHVVRTMDCPRDPLLSLIFGGL